MSDHPTRLFPKITDEALDALRRRVNVRIENTLEPWCHEATRDAIRHYAHGIGDDNPLWCDPDYAASTRWGGIVALPSFLFARGAWPRAARTSSFAGGRLDGSGRKGGGGGFREGGDGRY